MLELKGSKVDGVAVVSAIFAAENPGEATGALLEMAKREGLDKVYVHAFLDGRDTPPASGKDFVQELVDKIKPLLNDTLIQTIEHFNNYCNE